jgi:hypothetical protein
MVLLFALVCDELLVCGLLVCAATTATHPKPIAKIVLTRLISASLFLLSAPEAARRPPPRPVELGPSLRV